MALQIDEDGAVASSPTPGPIIDDQHTDRRRGGHRPPLQQAQHGRRAGDRQPQPRGLLGGWSSAQGQTQPFSRLALGGGAARIALGEPRQRFGKGGAGTAGRAAAQAAHHHLHLQRSTAARQIPQAAPIMAMHPWTGLATTRTDGAGLAWVDLHPQHPLAGDHLVDDTLCAKMRKELVVHRPSISSCLVLVEAGRGFSFILPFPAHPWTCLPSPCTQSDEEPEGVWSVKWSRQGWWAV